MNLRHCQKQESYNQTKISLGFPVYAHESIRHHKQTRVTETKRRWTCSEKKCKKKLTGSPSTAAVHLERSPQCISSGKKSENVRKLCHPLDSIPRHTNPEKILQKSDGRRSIRCSKTQQRVRNETTTIELWLWSLGISSAKEQQQQRLVNTRFRRLYIYEPIRFEVFRSLGQL